MRNTVLPGIRTIAFVGLGNMGAPMAARLVAKGVKLRVVDRRPEVARAFADAHGVSFAGTVAQASDGADAAITMLPDDRAVREVALDEGLATGLRHDGIMIDMGTTDPRTTVEVGKQLDARGVRYVDAPVMGGVVFAKDGTLDIMAGGATEDIDRCLPVFQALGRQVIRCGRLGSGHVLKALANYVNASALVTLVEALALGRKFGLESGVMADAFVQMCTGRQHPLEKKIIPQVLTHKFATGMALGLIAKDVSIATNFGRSIGALTPMMERLADVWGSGVAQIGASADQTEIARLWEEGNGITL